METTNLLEELPIYIDESSGLTLSILPRKSKYRKDCQKQDSKDLERRSGRCQTARPSRPQLCVGLVRGGRCYCRKNFFRSNGSFRLSMT